MLIIVNAIVNNWKQVVIDLKWLLFIVNAIVNNWKLVVIDLK